MSATAAPIDPAEFQRRLALLTELHALAALPEASLVPLVPGFREERFAAGEIVTSDQSLSLIHI